MYQMIISLAHVDVSSTDTDTDLPMADYASHLPPVGLAEGACDAMLWWDTNASVYRNAACITTSAQSEYVLSCWSAHQ